MTTRELWQRIMHYGDFDRLPVIHWTGWPETLERWQQEGMPAGVDVHAYFGTVPMWTGIGIDLGLRPAFEEEVLEDTPEYRIFRATDGVVQQDWKYRSCIPHFIDFTLKSAADWDQYKRRLQPDPARVPADLDERIRQADASGSPILVTTSSMMGWIRNWMGVENMSYLMYDDPDCYAEMVDTLAELACWGLDQVLPRARALGVVPDMGFGWEDICGKSGPLVSPMIFDRCVASGYRKIRAKLDQYGVPLFGLDSDGQVEPLIPNWMDAGINVLFPLEPGTWGATPEHVRERFGRELRIVGGYDKLALEKGPAAIEAELERHRDLARQGGLVLMPDHLITPGTSLANYRYYLEQVRRLRF
ncbi:MAG: uroporphyrinogen decarboxylase family protein [Candidatus Latescibacterota bacterium]|jgi:uroporphyrinogen decarboxylase